MSESYHAYQPPASKTCSICCYEKPLDAFHKGKNQCRECKNARRRAKSADRVAIRLIEKQKAPPKTSKLCCKCKTERPLWDFHRDKMGHHAWCRFCRSPLYPKKYKQVHLPLIKVCNTCHEEKNIEEFYKRKPHKDKKNEYDPICKACVKVRNKRVYLEHYEERIAKERQYLDRRREAIANGAIKPLQHRDPRLMCNAESTGRERATALGVFCAEDVSYGRIYERDKDLPCYICGKPVLRQHVISFDHVIPITRSGSHTEENIRLVHHACNCRKSARLLSEMNAYQRRGV